MVLFVAVTVPETHPFSLSEKDLPGIALGLRKVSESVPVCVTGIYSLGSKHPKTF